MELLIVLKLLLMNTVAVSPVKKSIHFDISERKILLRCFDVVFVFLMLFVTNLVTQFNYVDFSMQKGSLVSLLVLAIYLNIFGTIFDMYHLHTASKQLLIIKSILLTTSSTVLFFLLTPVFSPVLPNNRLQIIYFFFAILIGLIIWRIIYQKFIASHRFVKRVLLICDEDQSDRLIHDLQQADPNYKVAVKSYLNLYEGDYPTVGSSVLPLQYMTDYVVKNHVSEIVIANQNTQELLPATYNDILHLLERGYPVKEYGQVYEELTNRIPMHHMGSDFYRYFPFSRSNQNRLYLMFARLMEFFTAIVGILAGLIILPFIYIGNLIGNRGPLFYTQTRVGKNGAHFEIYKFRTMIPAAEVGGAVFATSGDARITRFGNIMRRLRIDEVPQFINILKGDMGFIGPRPERPFFVEEISALMPFYETRHVIKPGLTGWAQVNYSYGESIEDSLVKLQYDLYYIKHRSIFLDLNVIIKTIGTVVFYRGQ